MTNTTTGEAIRILVLEDRADDAELLVAQLRKAGYRPDWHRVDCADDLRAALADGSWDVIIADYSMPQFTAPDALAIVKALDLDVPFIIVSGSVGEEAAVEAMRAGAHDFFLKGHLTRLAAAVQRERGEARLRKERREAISELEESRERLRDAVRARDEFLSIASHELKTPLTSMSLQVETAQLLLQNPEQLPQHAAKLQAKLGSVSLQVSRLTTLINNLLDVARITSGRMALSPEPTDLRESVGTAVTALGELCARSGSVLELKAAAPVVGDWDRLRIESVIFNLLSNAIKYGEGRPIGVQVDIDAGRARLIVADQGIGIPTEEQERIFRRFERAVPPQHFGGFGLGLWVVREVVDAHGGTIAVSSAPHAGSTCTVHLPLAARRPTAPPEPI